MNKVQTKNSIIDQSLVKGKTTEEIITQVVSVFPEVDLSHLKRQIYSRRNVHKTRTLVAA